jgi:hypothetical protein
MVYMSNTRFVFVFLIHPNNENMAIRRRGLQTYLTETKFEAG